MNRWTRRLLPTLAAAAVLVTAGCTPHRDEVTFYGNYTAVNVGPAQWCDLDYATEQGTCDFPDEAARIDLHPGQPVQISVSPGIAEQGWLVVYQVATPGGGENDIRRTPLLADGELAQVIRVGPTEQIISAEVQAQLVQVSADAEGTAADFQPTKLWVLLGTTA